jgi:ribulose-phosphate 3-epimerase
MVGGEAKRTRPTITHRAGGGDVVSRTGWRSGVAVEPSIYAADFASLRTQLGWLLDAGASVYHFDVGDGHFIPEITMGPIVLESIADLVHRRGGVLDCHLMVEQPARHLEQIRAAGGDSVTFHIEAEGEPAETIALARDLGLGVGVACSLETPVELAMSAAGGTDFVLCMCIHPGLSGQEFIPKALGRIAELRRLLPDDVAVQADGGIHLGNIAAAREAGANLLVSGSGVFWNDDPAAAYHGLVKAAGRCEA